MKVYGKCSKCNRNATSIILRGYDKVLLCKYHMLEEKKKMELATELRQMETDDWLKRVKETYS